MEGAEYPYHAYITDSTGNVEKEGEYLDRKEAEGCARDFANMANSTSPKK